MRRRSFRRQIAWASTRLASPERGVSTEARPKFRSSLPDLQSEKVIASSDSRRCRAFPEEFEARRAYAHASRTQGRTTAAAVTMNTSPGFRRTSAASPSTASQQAPFTTAVSLTFWRGGNRTAQLAFQIPDPDVAGARESPDSAGVAFLSVLAKALSSRVGAPTTRSRLNECSQVPRSSRRARDPGRPLLRRSGDHGDRQNHPKVEGLTASLRWLRPFRTSPFPVEMFGARIPRL
jgi:hypothetical protein